MPGMCKSAAKVSTSAADNTAEIARAPTKTHDEAIFVTFTRIFHLPIFRNARYASVYSADSEGLWNTDRSQLGNGESFKLFTTGTGKLGV